MPSSCCAIGCLNRKKKGSNLIFYRIPPKSTSKRRKLWISAIRRKKWSSPLIRKARICSEHFISGTQTEDVADGKGRKKMKTQRRRLVVESSSESSNVDEVETVDDGSSLSGLEEIQCCLDKETQTEDVADGKGKKEINKLKTQVIMNKCSISRLEMNVAYWKKRATHDYEFISANKEKLNFFTGLNEPGIFQWIMSLIKDKVSKVKRDVSYENHLLLILMKIRLGVSNKDLGYKFNLRATTVSKIYRSWLPIISEELKKLIVWPSKPALRQNLPNCFKAYKNCVCIIDCTEIYIQRPLNLEARATTWSNYKHTHTIKYLIGINPAGAVTFLSHGWGGRVSDKEITIESGFLEFLEHGDSVLADRGFLIADELATRGAVLTIPAFTRGKKQLPASEVDRSRKIANVRIHVERVIGRLKQFKILSSIIPISQVDLLNDVMIIISALVNLNRSVVSKT